MENAKKMLWKNTNRRIFSDDFDQVTFEEIINIFQNIASEFPLNRLRLEFLEEYEGNIEFLVQKEELETDEEYENRLAKEEISRINRENFEKMKEVQEYNNYLKLKEKYEKDNDHANTI